MKTLIAIDKIIPDPTQPRKVFLESHINGLVVSIKQEGLINPIEVDQNYMIITGECRWRASKQLGLTEVPVTINDRIYNEYERLRHQMAENVHQSGSTYDTMMNPIDTARGYARLIKLKTGQDYKPGLLSHQQVYGHIKELTKEIGISEQTIREHLHLLDEPIFVQTAIQKGLPRTYIREANEAPVEFQKEIKNKIVSGDYNSREEVVQDIAILKNIPDLALLQIERQKAKESQATNRILNGIAKLALALEAQPLEKVDLREKGIVEKQLLWFSQTIKEYLYGE